MALVDFIIPTFDRRKKLHAMLSCINVQSDDDYNATVVMDGPYNEEVVSIVESFNNPRFRCKFLDRRYNDWGHTPRNIGKNASDAEYIVMTGDDNYYVPLFVMEIRKVVDDKPGMVYYDMIHNGYGYFHFQTNLQTGHIDMGAFATRNDIAKQIDLNPRLLAADGDFVAKFVIGYPQEKSIKIPKILFVHN